MGIGLFRAILLCHQETLKPPSGGFLFMGNGVLSKIR
jgi:hypothetical protein